VTVEIICDMHHVHPAIIRMVSEAAMDRMAFVTDATAAAGMQPGPFALGRLDAVLAGTEVTLASDPCTLAGSALTMDLAVKNAVRQARVPLEQALRAASTVPAETLRHSPGLAGLGTIAPGASADLVVLDEELDTVATIVTGHAVFDPIGLLG
jgi:N-acetylglucosamine-6-phosphate deacetylase